MAAVAQIMRSIKETRNYALNSDYETAITFYEGLDAEIAHHVASISADKVQLKSQWEEFRIQLSNEKALCVDTQGELRAMINPVEGVRRDRMLVNGGGGGSGGDYGGANASPRVPQQRADRNEVPYRQEHISPQQYQQQQQQQYPQAPKGTREWAAGGMPDYSNLGGNVAMGMDMGGGGGGGGGPPASSQGGRNEVNYGDRDRFAPPKANPTRQPNNNGGGGGGGWSNAYNNQNSNNQNGGGGGPAPKVKTKAPLPKFGGGGGNNNNGGGGGGAGARAPSKGAGNNNRPGTKQQLQQQQQKYVPRAGDEELAGQIENDMSLGNNSGVQWSDVAGHHEAKALLEEAVVFPVIMPDYYQGIRRPWKGVLLYGPPGTGKTMLAKAVASECGTTFFNMTSATLTSKFRGDSEKLVRILFEMARHYAPSTIFIDEIDSLCGQRGGDGEHEASRRAKSVLLTQMDGVGVDQSKIVMVLGATNHPWDIDEAMRRRLEQRIYIPLPQVDDCLELMQIHTKGTKNLKIGDDVDFNELARVAAGHNYSAADISNVVRDATFAPMRRYMKENAQDRRNMKMNAVAIQAQIAEHPVTQADFIESIRKMPSSVNRKQILEFEKWQAEFSTNQ